jgi:hypothetical protein
MSAAIVGTSASPIGQVRPPDPTAAAWSELVHLDHAVRVGTRLARDCRFTAEASTAGVLGVS